MGIAVSWSWYWTQEYGYSYVESDKLNYNVGDDVIVTYDHIRMRMFQRGTCNGNGNGNGGGNSHGNSGNQQHNYYSSYHSGYCHDCQGNGHFAQAKV